MGMPEWGFLKSSRLFKQKQVVCEISNHPGIPRFTLTAAPGQPEKIKWEPYRLPNSSRYPSLSIPFYIIF